MSLRSRLLAPLISALLGAMVVGLLTLSPAAADTGDARVPAPALRGDQGRADRGKQEPSAVFARSSYLCYGYQACRQAGMGNAGYAANNGKMYWRMYAGHNCTNYAAYRMVRSGLPNERPWSGGGNAMYWGTSMPKITDGTPRVGAVAWWKANTGPAGSVGHVAYVERVVSEDEIVISQDSWHGDFSWAVVTRDSGNWPSGFIHFNDVSLVNTAPPAVDGIAKVGAVLTSTAGAWRPAAASVTYQWFADGKPIKGAVEQSLKLTRARLGQQVSVTATATKLGYPAVKASSAPTAAVQPGQLENVTAPEITGDPKVDSSLSLNPGTWNPEPALQFQWLADGQPIDGAMGLTLAIGPDLVGRTISAQVTASREGYDPVTVTSAATAPVAPGTFSVHHEPSISGVAKLGQTLTVDPGSYSPGDADVALQWLRDGEPVEGATGPSYLVTNADLGARISTRVTLTRPGYTTTTVDSPRTTVVKTDPRMRVQTERGKHRVRVTVSLTAPGVSEVTGPVTIRFAGVAREVTLRGGTATVVLKDLPAGKRTMTIRYAGSDTVNRLVVTRTVRVG